MFTGGLGVHYGARALASVIPSSGGQSKRADNADEGLWFYNPDLVHPLALHLSDVMKEMVYLKMNSVLRRLLEQNLVFKPRSRLKRLGIIALDVWAPASDQPGNLRWNALPKRACIFGGSLLQMWAETGEQLPGKLRRTGDHHAYQKEALDDPLSHQRYHQDHPEKSVPAGALM